MEIVDELPYATRRLAERPDVIAPDGAEVRVLVVNEGASQAHFTLLPGQVARAVTHRSVVEIWYVLSGRGEMWRRMGDHESIEEMVPGVALDIPLGTHFQFRNIGDEPLAAVAVTIPAWPDMDEAYEVEGRWQPSV